MTDEKILQLIENKKNCAIESTVNNSSIPVNNNSNNNNNNNMDTEQESVCNDDDSNNNNNNDNDKCSSNTPDHIPKIVDPPGSIIMPKSSSSPSSSCSMVNDLDKNIIGATELAGKNNDKIPLPSEAKECNAIFVGDLHHLVTRKDLLSVFGNIGKIIWIQLFDCHAQLNRPFNFSFIYYSNIDDANKCIEELNFTKFYGNPCRVMLKSRNSLEWTNSNLIVKNLPPNTNSQILHTLFECYGNITSSKVKTTNTGRTLPYGYVQFSDFKSAQKAINAAKKKEIKLGDNIINAEWFKSRDERPNKQIFIKNIPANWDEKKIIEFIQEYTKFNIASISTKSSPYGKWACVAFYEFKHAQISINKLDGINTGDYIHPKLSVSKFMNKSERDKNGNNNDDKNNNNHNNNNGHNNNNNSSHGGGGGGHGRGDHRGGGGHSRNNRNNDDFNVHHHNERGGRHDRDYRHNNGRNSHNNNNNGYNGGYRTDISSSHHTSRGRINGNPYGGGYGGNINNNNNNGPFGRGGGGGSIYNGFGGISNHNVGSPTTTTRFINNRFNGNGLMMNMNGGGGGGGYINHHNYNNNNNIGPHTLHNNNINSGVNNNISNIGNNINNNNNNNTAFGMFSLYVGNIPNAITENHLQQIFESFGKIRTVHILEKTIDFRYGFVNFGYAEDAARALVSMNGKKVGNKCLQVKPTQKDIEKARQIEYFASIIQQNQSQFGQQQQTQQQHTTQHTETIIERINPATMAIEEAERILCRDENNIIVWKVQYGEEWHEYNTQLAALTEKLIIGTKTTITLSDSDYLLTKIDEKQALQQNLTTGTTRKVVRLFRSKR